MHPNEYNLLKAAYSVDELLDVQPAGRTTIYAEMKSGRLRATKIGKRTLFLAPDVVAWLNACRKAPAPVSPEAA